MSKDFMEPTNQNEEQNDNNIIVNDKREYTEPNKSPETKKYKNNKHNNIIIIILLLIFIIGISILVISLLNINFPFLKSNNETTNKNKVELKYTETSQKIKEGIYITDVSEVVENAMPSIVSITSKTLLSAGQFGPSFFGQNQYSEGAGSGIIISKSDTELLILTNNHVVENASELSVQFINEKSFDAKIKGTSERKDIAIISVPLKNLDNDTINSIKIATMGKSGSLKVGNGIIAIGNALGYGQSVTTGVVSALDREVSIEKYTNKMIQIDAAINGGNSGGALLNGNGEVVGINSAKYSSNALSSQASIEGMGFAIPIDDVSKLITSLMNGEEDSSASIGIEGYIISEQYNYNYGIPQGFYISKIVKGSGADKAKLEIGNVITEINGKKVTDLSDIQNVLYELNKGDKVTLTISYASGREYKNKKVDVTLS